MPAQDRSPATSLPVLGWKEQLALPDWGIRRLRAKLDTGARSSAIHVADLEIVDTHVSGEVQLPVLRFAVVLGRGDDARRHVVTTPSAGERSVRDTRGRPELRHVVRTRLVCGPLERVVDITITDRAGMNFRMILGRTSLEGACLVDPSRGYIQTPRPPRRGHR